MTHLRSRWRERLCGALAAFGLLTALSIAAAPASQAGDICSNYGYGSARCTIFFGGGSFGGGGGDDGDKGGSKGPLRPPCHLGAPKYDPVDCESDVHGEWVNDRKCYVLPSVPQPPPSDPRHDPNNIWYDCWGFDGEDTLVPRAPFQDRPSDGSDGGTLKEDLDRAIGTEMGRPFIGTAPSPVAAGETLREGRMAPVGTWIWLWPNGGLDTSLGPLTATDTDTGYYVNARIDKIEWYMGDGKKAKTCYGIDKAFAPWMKDSQPRCGYKYDKPGTYLASSRVTWHVDYKDEAGTNSETFTLPRRSFYLRIGENQAVNK